MNLTLIEEQAVRTYESILASTGDEELALLAQLSVQLQLYSEAGADDTVLEELGMMFELLRARIEARAPGLTTTPPPRAERVSISVPSIPGLGALKDWIDGKLDALGDLIGPIADRIRDVALEAVKATLPTLAEVAISLASTVGDGLGFIKDNLAELDDVALALGDGVSAGLENAAGELGNRAASALGNVLTAFLSPLGLDARPVRTAGALRLELGPDA